MPLLILTLLLLAYNFAELKRLNFMDSEGTQYAVLPEKSLDYPAAKELCRFNDAHLPLFPSFQAFVSFEEAYEETYAEEVRRVKFWISAIKLDEIYDVGNSNIWKADDGSGNILTRFPNQTVILWDDGDDDGWEPKECLTFGLTFKIFASEHCSNRNNVLCMRRLTDFLLEAGIPFADKLGNQYIFSKDQPTNYSEAKALCFSHQATLVSLHSDVSFGNFWKAILDTKYKYRDKSWVGLRFWLSATRTADKYTDGDNIWKVDNGLGTVFPRLSKVFWLDSANTSGNVSANCLYFDLDANMFVAVDCGEPLSIICKKKPLVLVPYVATSSSSSIQTTDANVPETTSRRVNDTSVIDQCSGIFVGTIVLCCILAVVLVIIVTISILFIRKIRMLKSACLCDKNPRKNLLFNSTISKGTKSPPSATSDKALATEGAIFCKYRGNESIIESNARGANPKMPKFKHWAKTKFHPVKLRKPAWQDSLTRKSQDTEYEFVGKPAEQNKKDRKARKT